jgi:mannose-6-phosphate isomerase-like protein (cupin superfamily)
MIRIGTHVDAGFRVMAEWGEWKVGMLRYNERFSRLGEMERHLLTDEVFVLVSGKATLYTDTEAVAMEIGNTYTVPVGVWHHIVVSEDALVTVVENRNTSIENTEKKYFEEKESITCLPLK